MPRPVAVIASVAGLAVIAFGIALTRIETPVEHGRMPRATLEPAAQEAEPAARKGDVRGSVRTPKDRPVSGVRVTLRPLFEAKGVEARTTRTTENGSFSFSDVRIDPGSPWVAEASYDGARFSSPVLRRPTDQRSNLELVVARTTRSDDDLRVRVESLALAGDAEGVQALHAISISNRGSRAYVGGLHLPLLAGAAAIREGTGLDRRRLELGHGEMISAAPLLPGAHELTYTYVTQMPPEGIRLGREIALPTDRYELLLSGEIESAQPRGLRDAGDVELGARASRRTYRRYIARGLDLVRVGAPIAAALIALAIVLVPLLRRRRRPEIAAPEPQTSQTPA